VVPGKWHYIRSLVSGLWLTVLNDSDKNGAFIIQGSANTRNQFMVLPIANSKWFTIKIRAHKLVLDNGGTKDVAAKMIQNTVGNSLKIDQQFKFEQGPPKKYVYIRIRTSLQVFDVRNESQEVGAFIQQYPFNNAIGQLFEFVLITDTSGFKAK